jgi:AraC-like DNA-binding protein
MRLSASARNGRLRTTRRRCNDQHFGAPRRTFIRRFVKATGMTPLNYTHALRLEEAKQMVETTDLPLDAIANEVGYQDTGFFGRLFRLWAYGASPIGRAGTVWARSGCRKAAGSFLGARQPCRGWPLRLSARAAKPFSCRSAGAFCLYVGMPDFQHRVEVALASRPSPQPRLAGVAAW